MHPLSALDDLDAYRQLFTDVALWEPYAQEVLARHHLEPRAPVRTGVPGTCPTFIVGERWVVKFFGRLFEGGACFAVEREAGRLVGKDPNIATARLGAEGELGESSWPWPYLIFDFIPGFSIGEVREQVSFEDQLRAAAELGETVRRLHALPLAGSMVFPDSHQPYLELLQKQREGVAERQHAWGLPERLVEQIDDFLLPPEELVDMNRPPHLIHADLTADHLLGKLENRRWRSLALIDFGDAMTGDLLYELCALYVDLFRCDRRLLVAFLKAYGLSTSQYADFPRKALSTMLLHRFSMFFGMADKLEQAASLEDLARILWEFSGE